MYSIMSYLAFNDMHEAWHQLWTFKEKVEVVKDDLWISKEEVQTEISGKWENKEMRVEINSEKICFWINSYFLMFMLKSHVASPDNETLQHIIIVADKLDEAGWCHSGRGNRERSEGTRNRNQRKEQTEKGNGSLHVNNSPRFLGN